MGIHVFSIGAGNIADSGTDQGLETQVDAALSTLLSNNIRNLTFQAKNAAGYTGVEFSVTVAYDDDGVTITSPYQIKVFKGASAVAAGQAAQTWITAMTGLMVNYWIGPVLTQYAPGMRQFTEPYYVLVIYNQSATDGPLNFQGVERPIEWKALATTTPAVTPFYAGGYIVAPDAAAELSDADPDATLGTAGQPFGARVFIVAEGPGTTDAGQVGVRVSGTAIADDGTTGLDTETILTDITIMDPNEFHQTEKRWVGEVTIELYAVDGAPTTFAFNFNYGFIKYETFDDRPFILKSLDIYGQAGAAEASPDILLKRINGSGWTYSLAAFVPDGGETLAQLSLDYSGVALNGLGAPYAWKRTNIDTEIVPTDNDGNVYFQGEGLLLVLLSPNDAAAFGNISINIGAQVF